MSRQFKTSQKNRTAYIYYTAEGDRITLTPCEDGITEADIAVLHTMDDAEVDEQRRINDHTSYLSAYHDGEDEEADDRNKYLIDPNADIYGILDRSEAEARHQKTLGTLAKAMQNLLPQQRELLYKVYFEGRTNTDIAAEECVSEAAIRNRLKKIYAKLQKSF